jgi:predicted DNA-binding transcriptional regulator YafY
MSHPQTYFVIMKRRNILGLLIGTPLASSQLSAVVMSNKATDKEISHLSDEHLQHWKTLPRYPVLESSDPVIQALIKAAHNQEPIPLTYHGGSTPGHMRLASIESLFRTDQDSYTYVAAYCHLRRQHRTFRADKISVAR